MQHVTKRLHIYVTEEEFEQIQKLKPKNVTYRSIILSYFDIKPSPDGRGRPRFPPSDDPKKQRRREYMREYINTRYKNDPRFRERKRADMKRYMKKIRSSKESANK